MSNFVPSALVAGQAVFAERMQAPEWRFPDSVALQSAIKGGIANPDLANVRNNPSRTVTLHMPIRSATTGKTAKSATHTGNVGDSNTVTPSWSQIVETFSISLKQANNNVLTWAEMYASSLRNAILNILNRADAAFVAALVAGKTQYNAGGGFGTFNSTDHVYEVPATEKDFFFQNLRDTLNFNLYRGMLIAVADSKASSIAQRLAAQGPSNGVNSAFQFQGVDVLPSTRTILSGYNGSAVAFEAGTVAFVPWIEMENRKALNPAKVVDYIGDWGQVTIPGTDINFAIHAYAARADRSGSGGQVQDVLIEFEVSCDFAYVAAPLSSLRGANDSVVYAAGLLN